MPSRFQFRQLLDHELRLQRSARSFKKCSTIATRSATLVANIHFVRHPTHRTRLFAVRFPMVANAMEVIIRFSEATVGGNIMFRRFERGLLSLDRKVDGDSAFSNVDLSSRMVLGVKFRLVAIHKPLKMHLSDVPLIRIDGITWAQSFNFEPVLATRCAKNFTRLFFPRRGQDLSRVTRAA